MARVTNHELKELLLEELEGKKPFEANRMFDCFLCGNGVEEGDEFFFFGDKKKVCNDCRDNMRILVEEKL